MEGVGEGFRGKDRFWMRWYLLGLPGFGTRERGDVWKGPRLASISDRVKGPRYLPLANSLLMMSLNVHSCSISEVLLGGEKVQDKGGIFAEKPKRSPSYMLGYYGNKPVAVSQRCQASEL